MGTRSLKYTFQLEFWTRLRHDGKYQYKGPLEWSGFIQDELLDNYMRVHDEYVELCNEGHYMDDVQIPIIPGEVDRENISKMLSGWGTIRDNWNGTKKW